MYMYVSGGDGDLGIFRQQNYFPNNLLFVIKSSVTQHAPSREIRGHSHSPVL